MFLWDLASNGARKHLCHAIECASWPPSKVSGSLTLSEKLLPEQVQILQKGHQPASIALGVSSGIVRGRRFLHSIDISLRHLQREACECGKQALCVFCIINHMNPMLLMPGEFEEEILVNEVHAAFDKAQDAISKG